MLTIRKKKVRALVKVNCFISWLVISWVCILSPQLDFRKRSMKASIQ